MIEHLDVFKDILPCLFTGHIAPMVHQLTLECPEEAFDTGIVSAMTCATHAGNKTVLVKDTLVARGGILTTPVRMVEEPRRGSPLCQRHCERLLGPLDGSPLAHRPADHSA